MVGSGHFVIEIEKVMVILSSCDLCLVARSFGLAGKMMTVLYGSFFVLFHRSMMFSLGDTILPHLIFQLLAFVVIVAGRFLPFYGPCNHCALPFTALFFPLSTKSDHVQYFYLFYVFICVCIYIYILYAIAVEHVKLER